MKPKDLLPTWYTRSGGTVEPFRTMQEEMERMLSRFGRTPSGEGFGFLTGDGIAAPNIDIAEEDGAVEVTMDVPGVATKDIEVSVENGLLTVSGRREEETTEGEKGKAFHRVERFRGQFVRRVALPAGVDEANAEARHENGVLTVRIPKVPEAQSRQKRIEIKSA